uniref:Uncharacterized protein n=1 Tax=Strongyloides papillosus TaxID=174720 RepID=A0A0N5C018_STREA
MPVQFSSLSVVVKRSWLKASERILKPVTLTLKNTLITSWDGDNNIIDQKNLDLDSLDGEVNYEKSKNKTMLMKLRRFFWSFFCKHLSNINRKHLSTGDVEDGFLSLYFSLIHYIIRQI